MHAAKVWLILVCVLVENSDLLWCHRLEHEAHLNKKNDEVDSRLPQTRHPSTIFLDLKFGGCGSCG